MEISKKSNDNSNQKPKIGRIIINKRSKNSYKKNKNKTLKRAFNVLPDVPRNFRSQSKWIPIKFQKTRGKKTKQASPFIGKRFEGMFGNGFGGFDVVPIKTFLRKRSV